MLGELVCSSLLAAVLALSTAPGPQPDVVRHRLEPAGPVGDVNLDGLVDYDDVIDHLFLWGPCNDAVCLGDLVVDGFVDVLDLLDLLDSLDHRSLMVDARVS
jgi:hypothetical protein